LIGKGQHALSWWQSGVLGLVSGQQDSLVFFFAQPVQDTARAAFTTT